MLPKVLALSSASDLSRHDTKQLCPDNVGLCLIDIAERYKMSNDVGHGQGDPGSNLSRGIFYQGMFFGDGELS